MRLTCHRCDHEWDYQGQAERTYATCPKCYTKVKVEEGPIRRTIPVWSARETINTFLDNAQKKGLSPKTASDTLGVLLRFVGETNDLKRAAEKVRALLTGGEVEETKLQDFEVIFVEMKVVVDRLLAIAGVPKHLIAGGSNSGDDDVLGEGSER